MRLFRRQRPILIALASLSIAYPWQTVSSAEVEKSNADRPATTARPTIHDVVMQSDGRLHGMVVDSGGKPCPQCEVIVSQDGRPASKMVTDDEGGFELALPRGGVYHLASSESSAWFRVWQPKTAPPRAADQALLVQGIDTYRGQWSPTQALFSHPHFVLGVAALLVAIPVLIHNNRSDRRPAS